MNGQLIPAAGKHSCNMFCGIICPMARPQDLQSQPTKHVCFPILHFCRTLPTMSAIRPCLTACVIASSSCGTIPRPTSSKELAGLGCTFGTSSSSSSSSKPGGAESTALDVSLRPANGRAVHATNMPTLSSKRSDRPQSMSCLNATSPAMARSAVHRPVNVHHSRLLALFAHCPFPLLYPFPPGSRTPSACTTCPWSS